MYHWVNLVIVSHYLISAAISEEFTLGNVNVSNVTFTEQLPDGLYSLGEVQDDGYFKKVCVIGRTITPGSLYFYTIDGSGEKLTVRDGFAMNNVKNNELTCKKQFDIENHPRKNDIIAVFITSDFAIQKRNPVEIAFKSSTRSKLFVGSNAIARENTTKNNFDKKMRAIIASVLSSGSTRHINNISLNVEVTIQTSCSKINLQEILIPVTVCIIIVALLITIGLLIVKLFRKNRKHNSNDQPVERPIEMPAIKVTESDTEDADRDFSDVHYLLQKDAKRAVININHYHGSHQDIPAKAEAKKDHVYSLLTNPAEGACDSTGANVSEEHDYDEPYFEPACTEESLLAQLKSLHVPLLAKQTLRLSSKDLLGQGAFGSVYKGVLYSVLQFNQLVEEEVAVKTMEDEASEEDRIKFLQEAAIMGQFTHPNIIKILGVVITPESCKIVVEVMAQGDLRNHLQTIKPNDIEYELAPTLLSYSRHVANGMMYLAVKAFVHRDLAARNVLVAEDGVCKIADFGLSRKLQDEDYYVSHGGKIPVKWTAPEALHYHKYSTASDVWSYGCVLYEIWSLGKKPYHDLTNEQIIEKLTSGFRLSPPPGCPRDVYQIMMQCWNPDPLLRPSFMDISSQLQKPDYQVLKWREETNNISSCTTANEAKVIGATLEAGAYLHQDLQKAYVIDN